MEAQPGSEDRAVTPHAQALQEIQSGECSPDAYARALAKAAGDTVKAQGLYIELRAAQIKIERSRLHAAHTKEQRRLDKLKYPPGLCWSAFFFGPVWLWFHEMRWRAVLFLFLPVIGNVILLFKGNRWAWRTLCMDAEGNVLDRTKAWASFEDYEESQWKWARIGWVVAIIATIGFVPWGVLIVIVVFGYITLRYGKALER